MCVLDERQGRLMSRKRSDNFIIGIIIIIKSFIHILIKINFMKERHIV